MPVTKTNNNKKIETNWISHPSEWGNCQKTQVKERLWFSQWFKYKRQSVKKVPWTINCMKTGTSLLVSAEGSEILKHPGCLWIYVFQHKQTDRVIVIFLLFQSNARKKIVFLQGINQRCGFAMQLEQSKRHQRSCPSSTSWPEKTPTLCRTFSCSGPGLGEAEESHANGLGFKLPGYAYFFKGTLEPKDGGHVWGCKGVFKGGWNWTPLVSSPDRYLPNSSVLKVNPHHAPLSICGMWLALKIPSV